MIGFRPIVVFLIVAVLAIAESATAQETVTREENANRFGSDYRGFDLPDANPELCRKACESDPQCRAYTYVNPGVQGPKARCYLKNPAPAATADACCISGVKREAPMLSLPQRSSEFVFQGAFSTEVAVERSYPDGAELYWRSGDFVYRDVKEVHKGQSAPQFLFDISKLRGAKAILWQLSVKPFAPFTGDGPAIWNPDGLVASGLVGGRTYFDVDVEAAVAEAKRQSRHPTLVFGDGRLCESPDCDGFRFIACSGSDGSGELVSFPEIRGHRLDWCKHWGRECGEPAATLYCRETGYSRAMRWAIDPNVGAGAENQEQWTFYLRVVPLNGPAVAGKPSNVMRILYNFLFVPPDFKFYSEEKSRAPAPSYQLTGLRYRAWRYIHEWPDGCKIATGRTHRPPAILRAVLKVWDYLDEAYEKAQDLIVETFDTLTFGAIPKNVWQLGLDAAMMYAGVPPDIPNMEEMLKGNVDYVAAEVARVAVEQVPAGSVIPGTDDIVADVILGSVEETARDKLQDKMRREIENRTRQAIYDSAEEFERLIKKEYKYCVGKSLYPTYFVTVRNGGGRDIPNFRVEITDTEQIFQAKSVEVMLRAGQTMTIPLAPEKNIRNLPDRWQFTDANVHEEISNWWNEWYTKRQTKVIVRASGDAVCRDPLGPRGLVCETEMKSIYISPQARVMNRDYNLLQ